MRDYDREGVQPETAYEALRESYANTELSKLVSNFAGVKPPPTRKDDLLAALARFWADEQLQATWARLTAREQAMVAQTAWSETGFFDQRKFGAIWRLLRHRTDDCAGPGGQPEDDPNVIFGSRWTEKKGRKPSLIELLMPRGVMSREIQRRLRAFVPEPKPPAMVGADAPPEFVQMETYAWNDQTRSSDRSFVAVPVVRRDMEPAALRDLPAVLRVVDSGKVTVTEKNRWPTPGAMRQVAGVLEGGDYFPEESPRGKKPDDPEDEAPGPIRAFAWPMLLQAGKLVQVRGSRLELTKAGRAALAAPPHEVIRGLWERWASSELLDELRRINVIRGQTGNGARYLTDPAERRQIIAAGLRQCPPGGWVGIDEFAQQLRAAGSRLEISSNPWTLYIAEQQYGSLAYDNGDVLESRYLLCLLMEYAATLGIIDVAYIPPAGARSDYGGLWGTDDLAFFSRYDGLLFLRLTGLGAYVLGIDDSYAPPAPPIRNVLEVHENLELVAIGPLAPADELMLNAFAERSGENSWRLDPDRILSAEESGRGVGELVAFLDAASGEDVPDAVDRFLREIAARASALRDLGPARLIACADPDLAAFIAGHPVAGKSCRLAGKDALVVRATDAAPFRRALRKLGFVLRESSSDS